jgi:hypothetical protein
MKPSLCTPFKNRGLLGNHRVPVNMLIAQQLRVGKRYFGSKCMYGSASFNARA